MKTLYRLLLIFLFLSLHSHAYAQETWEWTTPTEGTENILEDEVLIPDTVIFNEVYPYPASGEEEYIELYNYGTEPLSLDGWSIRDRSSTVHRFTANDRILAGGYVLLEGSFSLNNTTDEDIMLIDSQAEVQDTLSYTADEVIRGNSLSRACDVYELRFCELFVGENTPGIANQRTVLDVIALTPGGTVKKGTYVELRATVENAEIWYTTEANAPFTEQIRYESPIEITENMSIYFYAVVQGTTTPIHTESYTLSTEGVEDLYINEIYFSSTTAWIELHNPSLRSTRLGGKVLRIIRDGNEEEFSFEEDAVIYPTRFYTIELPGSFDLNNAEISVYERDGQKSIDTVLMPSSLHEGNSYIRTNFVSQREGSMDTFMQTSIPTKNTGNIVVTILSEEDDVDGDLLSEEEEVVTGTDAKIFDTNENNLPDFYDRGADMLEKSHQYLYRALLSKMLYFTVEWGKDVVTITGRSLPKSRVTTVVDYTPYEAVTDVSGKFIMKIPTEKKSLYLSFYVIDQGGVSSFNIGPFLEKAPVVPTPLSEGDVRIVRALANPEGSDSRATEWIELLNTTDQVIVLTPTIRINTQKKTLLSMELLPGVPYRLYGSDLGMNVANTAEIELLMDTMRLDVVSYTSAKEDEIIVFVDQDPMPPVARTSSQSSKTSLSSAQVRRTVKLLPVQVSSLDIPSLQEVHTAAIQGYSDILTMIPPVEEEKRESSSPEKGYAIGIFLSMLLSSVGSFIWKW